MTIAEELTEALGRAFFCARIRGRGRAMPTLAQSALIALARNTPLGHYGVARLARRLLLRIGPAVIDAEAFGARARLHLEDNPCEWKALLNRRYNRAERLFLMEGVRPGGGFVDIGANVGLYTLAIAAAHGRSVRILAVEPHPVVRRRLEYNLAARACHRRASRLRR